MALNPVKDQIGLHPFIRFCCAKTAAIASQRVILKGDTAQKTETKRSQMKYYKDTLEQTDTKTASRHKGKLG